MRIESLQEEQLQYNTDNPSKTLYRAKAQSGLKAKIRFKKNEINVEVSSSENLLAAAVSSRWTNAWMTNIRT